MAELKTPEERLTALEAAAERLTNLEVSVGKAISTESATKDLANGYQLQLTRMVNAKANVNTIAWQAFSLFNAGMAVVANGVAQTPYPLQGLALSAVGLVAALIWKALQLRMFAHLEIHEDATENLEKRLGVEIEHSSSRRSNAHQEKLTKASRLRGRDLIIRWVNIVLFAWAASFVFHAVLVYGDIWPRMRTLSFI